MSPLAAEIFGANDLKQETVEVPEWGGVRVHLRELTVGERARFAAVVNADAGVATPWLVAMTALDSDGNPAFGVGEERERNIAKLAEKSGSVMQRLANVVMRLSGLQRDEQAGDPAGN